MNTLRGLDCPSRNLFRGIHRRECTSRMLTTISICLVSANSGLLSPWCKAANLQSTAQYLHFYWSIPHRSTTNTWMAPCFALFGFPPSRHYLQRRRYSSLHWRGYKVRRRPGSKVSWLEQASAVCPIASWLFQAHQSGEPWVGDHQ